MRLIGGFDLENNSLKGYCKLNIEYRFPMDVGVKCLYPFRNKISKNSKLGGFVSGMLQMEEIKRSCR